VVFGYPDSQQTCCRICLAALYAATQRNSPYPRNEGNQICVRANLYRDGTLVSEVTTESNSALHGCRGAAVGSDEGGNARWTVKLLGKRACSRTSTPLLFYESETSDWPYRGINFFNLYFQNDY